MIRKFILLIPIALMVQSCTSDFEELNRNNNAPEEVAPQFLLSNILWQTANRNTQQGWLAGNFLAQHTSNLEFLPIDRYDLGTNTEYWNHLYRMLNDIQSLQESASDNEAYQAVGNVMKAWVASQLTDLWGDVPFFEAIKGKNDQNFKPRFDAQRDIYLADNGILDLLRKANATLSSTNDVLTGDILYHGDIVKWQRFANALRVRYLLRISSKSDVAQELRKLFSDEPLFESNNDNAGIPYLSSSPNQWFIYAEREGRYTDVRMSKTAQELLQTADAMDPRISTYFKVGNPDSNYTYLGMPNGLSRESQNAFNLSQISLLGHRFRDVPDGLDAVLMTYSELKFCLAEAAQKGLISASFQDLYEEAITAHFDQLELDLGDYLSSDFAATGGKELEAILTQKWVAQLMNGHEAWLDYRRTGFPKLEIPKDNLNGNQFPVRYRYPESEQAVNGTHYADAVAQMGGDSYNEKGWWE